MKAQRTVGVIGHVDHGKTRLVKALTGIDTDRLAEEKARGLSIVNGYAWLEFAGGVVDLIDVPGHENFVRTMISGATGIDAALLVVAAGEGIKPQTREHLDIIRLIGVRSGIVAITKADLLEPEDREGLLAEVAELLADTPLAGAPVVFTSALRGAGLEALRQALEALLEQPAPRRSTGPCYLPIDRVFTLPGHGTVVTGTLRLGILGRGQTLEIAPRGLRATVRQIQVHNRPVIDARPGQRVGVNLRGIKRTDLNRGDLLAEPGLLAPSERLDAELTLLPGAKALQHGQQLRLLWGSAETLVRVRLLDRAELASGETAFVQLKAAEPVTAAAGEPFILRLPSPPATVGGGRILDPAPNRHRLHDCAVLHRLEVLARGSLDALLLERLRTAGEQGATVAALAAGLALTPEQVRRVLAGESQVVLAGETALLKAIAVDLRRRLLEQVEDFHRRHPGQTGSPLAACRAALGGVGEAVFALVLDSLVQAGRLEVAEGRVRRRGFDPWQGLSGEDRRLAGEIETAFATGGLNPPDWPEVIGQDRRRQRVFQWLVEAGVLVPLRRDQVAAHVVFHRDALAESRRRIGAAFPPPADFTVSEVRRLLGSTRKFVVPLLEHLDASRYTRRQGDRRIVQQQTVFGGE